MSRIKLWLVLLLLILVILFIIGWIIIGTYRANHTDEIARAILFGKHDKQDFQANFRLIEEQNYAVINAAINTRFPKGSSPENAKVFFEKLGSTCEIRSNKSIFCHLPESAGLCMSLWIEITIDVAEDGSLKNIYAKPNSLYC